MGPGGVGVGDGDRRGAAVRGGRVEWLLIILYL